MSLSPHAAAALLDGLFEADLERLPDVGPETALALREALDLAIDNLRESG